MRKALAMFRRHIDDAASKERRPSMGHRDRTCNFGGGLKGTGEAKDISHREGKASSDLKALLCQVRHVALADLTLARKLPGAFDGDSVLLTMLAHRQVPASRSEVLTRRSLPEKPVRGRGMR